MNISIFGTIDVPHEVGIDVYSDPDIHKLAGYGDAGSIYHLKNAVSTRFASEATRKQIPGFF